MAKNIVADRDILAGYGLDIEKLRKALAPTLPTYEVHEYNYVSKGNIKFTAHYQTSNPDDERGNPDDEHLSGWVGRFDLDVRRRDVREPVSPDNRSVALRQCAIYEMTPYPELFNPIIEKIQALIDPDKLQIFMSAGLLKQGLNE